MPGYTNYFVDALRHQCYCFICRRPMYKPVKIATCGHRFCDQCLQEYLSAGILKCPEDSSVLDYATIFHDTDTEAEIMNGITRCQHYQRGCRWTDKLHNLQEHLDGCTYASIRCPNKCPVLLTRQGLNDHLEYMCPLRIVKCEFCSASFSSEEMEDRHSGSCPMEVVWCENKCGAKLMRKYLTCHMASDCHKRKVACPYCSREFVEETLQTHQYQCPRFPITCPNRCDPAKIAREEIDLHIEEVCPSATVACPYTEAGCNFTGPRYGIERHLDDNTKSHLKMMWTLVSKQQQQIQQLSSTLHTVANVTNGTFVWRINDYKQKCLDGAYNTSKQEIHSQPFYTSRHGYKMMASVFPNGNSSGEGRFLSVYIKLLPGEYDNILDWPFTLPVSITLYDQTNDPEKRTNITDSFLPEPSWKHFQKPVSEKDTLGFGYPKFVSHEILKTRCYTKDDSIIMKIRVDNSRFIIP